MATQRHVDTGFSTAEMALSLDDYAERITKPKMNNLGGNVAKTVISAISATAANMRANFAGTAIQSPNAQTFVEAGAVLDDNSAPLMGTKGDRKIVNDPWTDARTSTSLQGLFNPQQQIGEQYAYGAMKQALGFSWMRDQTVVKHTAGTFTAAAVQGANQTGNVITTGAQTGNLNQGDIITIAGVNAVNRVTKQSTGMLRQFVVTSATVGGVSTTINIYPALIPPSGGNEVQYQTVTASPADTAPISLYTAPSAVYRKSLAYAPEAITMVTADLYMPTKGVIDSARAQFDGISMRSISAYLPGSDQAINRDDVLFGYLAIRPEWICAIPDAI